MTSISIIDYESNHHKIYKNVEKYGHFQLDEVYEKIKELIDYLKREPLKHIEESQIHELLGLFHRLEHRALEYNKYGFKRRPLVCLWDMEEFQIHIANAFNFLYAFLKADDPCSYCVEKQSYVHQWFINLKNKNENKITYLENIEQDLQACITSARGYQRFLKDRGNKTNDMAI